MSLEGYTRKLDAVERVNKTFYKKAGVISLEFIKDRFRAQNWIGSQTEAWPRAKYPMSSGTPGTKTGALRRSYRITSSNSKKVVIGTDKAQAPALNEGKSIVITQRMRKFFWAKHLEAKEAGNDRDGEFWLGMATTKKSLFKLPKYKHIGASPQLYKKIQTQITNDYEKALKQ